MILNGFTGRIVSRVEREKSAIRVVFQDGGYLYVRAVGPDGTILKIGCMKTRCRSSRCKDCMGIVAAPSE